MKARRFFQYNLLQRLLMVLLVFYKKGISCYLPMACRYYPSCSDYAYQALRTHGLKKGLWLMIKRLARCQPWGGHGIDHVPAKIID